MTIKSKLLALIVLLGMFTGAYYASYLKGRYAHSDKVNSEQSMRPIISEDLMSPSCKASDAGRDSD